MAMLGLAAAAGRPSLDADRRPLLGRLEWALPAAAAACLLAVGLLLPWMAARELEKARKTAASDPAGALARLDRAAGLNPLSVTAQQTAGVIEAERGRLDSAERLLGEAREREPDNPFTLLELGAIASTRGRPVDALLLVDRAQELSPRDEPTLRALDRLVAGRTLSPERVNADIREDIDVRIGPG